MAADPVPWLDALYGALDSEVGQEIWQPVLHHPVVGVVEGLENHANSRSKPQWLHAYDCGWLSEIMGAIIT
jgi:hypothetical protein